MKLHHALAALAAGSFAVSASAQQLKPGLWEITNKMQGGGTSMDKSAPDLQQQMANMPPEQRKAIEAMMAKQGMKMGAGGPGSMSVKTCMTKEMVERNEIPAQQGDCKTTKQQRSGNTINMAFACTSPPSSGEGQFTIQSPEAYTMKMDVKSTGGGQPRAMRMDASGKWLGADCGNIKPIQPRARK
ncbi:MAG TPA: DUF3617 domain-containing protein [Burkholderiales bacterium]|nr:DUF3617 domain-containing protein [Burkholderiales bacterium]